MSVAKWFPFCKERECVCVCVRRLGWGAGSKMWGGQDRNKTRTGIPELVFLPLSFHPTLKLLRKEGIVLCPPHPHKCSLPNCQFCSCSASRKVDLGWAGRTRIFKLDITSQLGELMKFDSSLKVVISRGFLEFYIFLDLLEGFCCSHQYEPWSSIFPSSLRVSQPSTVRIHRAVAAWECWSHTLDCRGAI